MNEEKTEDLGITTKTKPSNTSPTVGTASEPNALKRVVTVGRKPEEKEIAIGGN